MLHSIAPLKLLIVEDEPAARSALLRLCERNGDVQVIGEAESGTAAIDAAERLCPDVMLLDVELPDMTGFDVLRAAQDGPLGIMVTAHAGHAVSAYAAGALDYLLTPVSTERFAESMERARQRCAQSGAWHGQPRTNGDSVQGSMFKRLMGERQHRLYPLDAETIDYIEAEGNYVTIRAGTASYISRDSIKRLANVLAEHGFIRIERSLLVNIRAVLYVESAGRGAFAFTLSCGSCLHSSASYREAILRVLPMRRLSSRRQHQPTSARG